VERATGVLAGRLGCPWPEAEGHLARLAAEQRRSPEEVAADLLDALDAGGFGSRPDDARPLQPEPEPWGPDAGPPPVALPTVTRRADDEAVRLRDRLAGAIGADAVILMAVQPDGALRIVGTANAPAHVVSRWQHLPPRVVTPATEAATTGRPVWLPDVTEARQRYALIDDRWSSRAWLPVRRRGRVIGVIGVLWADPCPFDPAARQAVARLAATGAGQLRRLLTAAPVEEGWGDWLAGIQPVFDVLPTSAAVLSPVRDADGAVVDFTYVAASPEAVDVAGRRGGELVSRRLRDCYPTIFGTEVWMAHLEVLAGGQPREIGPFAYVEVAGGVQAEAVFTLRISRFGTGLLISWNRHDEQQRLADRIARTERLGNLGWYERDLLNGRSEWSDQVYRIFEVDPVAGPLPLDVLTAQVLPEDRPRWTRATGALIERAEPMDVEYRVLVNGKVKYLRSFGEAIRDAPGRTMRIFGVVQDVTAREEARQRLAEVQRQLAEHRRNLDAEHRLAMQLQQIILPVPEKPVDLTGLRVAVRYLPAEHIARIGGDWYHATTLPCGRTLLAIGDVAGHGLRAAATMGQLRHALAALAVATTEPAELLRLLNRLLFDTGDGATATAVVARYDPGEQSLTWAQAGHPAPLMARGGVPAPLPRPRGLLLGAVRDAVYEEATVPMAVGDLLLLYTDGLVERPGRTVTEGLDEVVAAVTDAMTSAPEQPLARLIGRLHQANPDDDTCIVAARPLAEGEVSR
jgi:serine phosphatase RsbU (regulator of sigma subunit)